MTKRTIERVQPGSGQESVWDYPRPPKVEPSRKHVVVRFGGRVLADSLRAVRVCETASPPVYYLPPDDVRMELLRPSGGRQTFCEWKGLADYLDVQLGELAGSDVAWVYAEPNRGFEAIAGYVAFYPGRVASCEVDGEQVRPQSGRYYGGWITDEVVGPFKGDPGTEGW